MIFLLLPKDLDYSLRTLKDRLLFPLIYRLVE